MTEGRWQELGAALHDHRLEVIRIAGRMAQRSLEMAEFDPELAYAEIERWQLGEAEDARDLASQVERIVQRTDALLDDTAVMQLDDVAEAHADDE